MALLQLGPSFVNIGQAQLSWPLPLSCTCLEAFCLSLTLSIAEPAKHLCGHACEPALLTSCRKSLLLETCGVALKAAHFMLQTLSELQDRLPPFPTEIALQLIEEDLGQPASAIMSVITPEPVAAASLGQVYISHFKGLTASVGRPCWLPHSISVGTAIIAVPSTSHVLTRHPSQHWLPAWKRSHW